MKIKVFVLLLIIFAATRLCAQPNELKDAGKYYDTYSKNGLTKADKAKSALISAKQSIDKANANEKTFGQPKTYALLGAIYSGLSLQESVSEAERYNFFKTAEDATEKGAAQNPDKESGEIIQSARLNLAQPVKPGGEAIPK